MKRTQTMASPDLRERLRRLGWLTLVAFTVKGVMSTTLIVAAVLKAGGGW